MNFGIRNAKGQLVKNARIQAIQANLAHTWQHHQAALQSLFLGLPDWPGNIPAAMQSILIHRRPPFRPSSNDIHAATRPELHRPPVATLRAGGDCDAINLGFAGLVILAGLGHHHGSLGSLFLPDIDNPRHAVLAYDLGDGFAYTLDLTVPNLAMRTIPARGFCPWTE